METRGASALTPNPHGGPYSPGVDFSLAMQTGYSSFGENEKNERGE